MAVIGNIEKAAANAAQSLDDLIGEYKKRLDRTLRATENKILDLTTRISLDAKGNVKGPKFTLAQTARIQGQLEGIFDENYGKLSRQFATDISGVTKIVKKAHSAVDLPVSYSKVDMKMLKNLQEQTLIGLQAFSAQTQERISQSIQDAVVAGKPYRKLTNEIKNHITGLTDVAGRPLKQYAGVYAQDGLMNAYRTLSMQKAEAIKVRHFVWMGNVIAGTRPMCANSAGKAFTEQELQELDLSSWAGKSCSVFACCGGWNCRHMLMPISDSYFNEMKGKPIEVPNWFTEHGKPIPALDMKIISPKTYKKDMQTILTKAEIEKRKILMKPVPTKPVLPVKPVAFVPRPFVLTKTIKEAEVYLKNNTGISTIYKGMEDVEIANMVNKEIIDLYHKTKGLKTTTVWGEKLNIIDEIKTADLDLHTIAEFNQLERSIKLNKNIFKNIKSYKKEGLRLKDVMVNVNPAAVIDHEIAHGLVIADKQLWSVKNRIWKALGTEDSVSKYSMVNADEMVAEAFVYYLDYKKLPGVLKELEPIFERILTKGASL